MSTITWTCPNCWKSVSSDKGSTVGICPLCSYDGRDEVKVFSADPIRLPMPPAKPEFKRDPGLVRAELVDAMRDYANIFREKAQFELSRAEAVEAMAAKIEAGGAAENPDIIQSQEWAHAHKLLEMRFNELQMRCNRLILEHGSN